MKPVHLFMVQKTISHLLESVMYMSSEFLGQFLLKVTTSVT